jgi:hypothetical protein
LLSLSKIFKRQSFVYPRHQTPIESRSKCSRNQSPSIASENTILIRYPCSYPKPLDYESSCASSINTVSFVVTGNGVISDSIVTASIASAKLVV